MKLSEYAKIFHFQVDIDEVDKVSKDKNIYSYYHSLRMIPVYLNEDEHNALQDGRFGELPDSLIESLRECRILVDNDEKDLIHNVRRLIPKPYICIAYFILTEQCNLACKYCFLGNASCGHKITDYHMSREIAEKALLFFAEQTAQQHENFNSEKNIIFYGGEPLLNFNVLKFIVEKSRELQNDKIITENLTFSVVTNGMLLDSKIISFLRENNINVSISLDGAGEAANSSRIDRNGRSIYQRLIDKIGLAVNMGLDISLSVTLTENTIKEMNELINLLQRLGIKSLCFNILNNLKDFRVSDDYYANATRFICEFYRRTRTLGIYEERLSRKLKSFASQKIYFADCAAASGNQIVITPDGGVGICQGCTENREHFFTNINNNQSDLSCNENIKLWSRLSPVFKEECRTCEALGICGGGCPINADSLGAIDRAFCTHAKMTLEFLIRELFYVMKNEKIK